MNQTLNKEVENNLLLKEPRIKPIKSLLNKNSMVLDIQSMLFDTILFDNIEKKDTTYCRKLNYLTLNKLDKKNNTHCIYNLIRHGMKLLLIPNLYSEYTVEKKKYYDKDVMDYNITDIQDFLKVFCYYYDINTDYKEIKEVSRKLKKQLDNCYYQRNFINVLQLSFNFFNISSNNTDYLIVNEIFKTMLYREIVLLCIKYDNQNRLDDFVIQRLNYL